MVRIKISIFISSHIFTVFRNGDTTNQTSSPPLSIIYLLYNIKRPTIIHVTFFILSFSLIHTHLVSYIKLKFTYWKKSILFFNSYWNKMFYN